MDEGQKMTDSRLTSLEKKIRREYKGAQKTLESRIKKYLEKFKLEDEAQAKKLAEGKITEQAYKKWRASKMLTGKYWQDTLDALTEDITNADKIAAAIINKEMPSIYAMNANYGTYEVESGLRINTSFSLYDEDTVEKLLQENPKIIPKAKPDIPKDMRWNRRKLTSAITQGVLSGDSIPNIAKRLQSVTNMDMNAALRNARTYTTAAESGGRIEAYKRAEDLGIELEQEWMATLDENTRQSHRALDGERVPVGGTFSNGCTKPGDPNGAPEEIYNCRCRLVAALKGYDYKSERFARLPAGMTYDEWKEARPSGKQNKRKH